MRYAILSGYLAAKSLIEGSDYDMLWKRGLKPMLETSLINRYLFEKGGTQVIDISQKSLLRAIPVIFSEGITIILF